MNNSLDLMRRMGMVKDYAPNFNFLNEIRNTTNKAPLVSINEVNAKSLLDRHTKSGYIIVSPCRGYGDFGLNPNTDAEKLARINKERIRELIELIKESGFSYTPVYGGFVENQGSEDEEIVYERSFVVYPFDRKGELCDFAELRDFGVRMAKRFNQDSVLVCEPNENPKYINQMGEIDFELPNKVAFNDLSQTYFTDLHKNTNKFKDMADRKPTRFSFVESYINPRPNGYSERYIRDMDSEIFITK